MTRRKADTWDRIKFLVLLGIIMTAIIASSPDLGFLSFGEVLGNFFATTAGWVLGILFGLEVLRQIHYFISEKSAAYHSFWRDGVFGGMERFTHEHFKPWTRFRVGRMFRWTFYLIILGVLLD
ncbi:MAG TPA: ATPase, partial [Acidimicrobiia bacterium]